MRLRSFRGGYRFTRFRGRPQAEVLEAALPHAVALRLAAGLAPAVRPGDAVVAGDIVARDDASVSSPLAAPISGAVEKAAGGLVAIRGDGSAAWRRLEGASTDWSRLPVERIEDLLYLSGASALGASGIPTRFRSARVAPADAVDVIVTAATGGEPFEPMPSAVLGASGAAALLDGVGILRRLMPRARFHLALSRSTRALLAAPAPEWLRVVLLEEKYPALHESVLVASVLGTVLPAWRRAVDAGVVILDLQAVLQARAAVTEGRPLIDRLVALGGPGFARTPHVRARIGTTIGDLARGHLDSAESRLIVGSALTGEALEDPAARCVEAGTSLVVALGGSRREIFEWMRPGLSTDSYCRVFVAGMLPLAKRADTGLHGEHRPCLTCNFCDRVCPAGILPHLLHRYVRRNIIEDSLVRYRMFDCIDCNLCTYVCPSKIPVAQLMADGKRRLREEGLAPVDPAARGSAKEAKPV